MSKPTFDSPLDDERQQLAGYLEVYRRGYADAILEGEPEHEARACARDDVAHDMLADDSRGLLVSTTVDAVEAAHDAQERQYAVVDPTRVPYHPEPAPWKASLVEAIEEAKREAGRAMRAFHVIGGTVLMASDGTFDHVHPDPFYVEVMPTGETALKDAAAGG